MIDILSIFPMIDTLSTRMNYSERQQLSVAYLHIQWNKRRVVDKRCFGFYFISYHFRMTLLVVLVLQHTLLH